jgi:peroxiredoxin
MPELDAVYQKYRFNPSVAIYAVNPLIMDTPENAQDFIAKRHLTLPVAYDKNFAAPKEVAHPGDPGANIAMPVVLLLDREGKQQWFTTGGAVGDTNHAFEKELIAKIDAQLAQK